MNPIPLIRASQIKPFSDYLNRVGTPVERFMKQARLPVFAVDEKMGTEQMGPEHNSL
jgi:hypothetical protein